MNKIHGSHSFSAIPWRTSRRVKYSYSPLLDLFFEAIMNEIEYQQSLPRKRMAAGALFVDATDRVLILKPSYREHWEIPGGVVEHNESPAAAVVREVFEELGLSIDQNDLRLLSVDYLHADAQRTKALMFIFFAGIVESADISKIQIATEEIEQFCFVPLDEATVKLGEVLGPRMRRCYDANKSGSSIYFENIRGNIRIPGPMTGAFNI